MCPDVGLLVYLRGGEEGGYRLNFEISKFHCFTTHFASINCSSETTKGRRVKVTFSESSLQDQFRNLCFKTMAVGLLEVFGTKDYYFTTHVTKHVLT